MWRLILRILILKCCFVQFVAGNSTMETTSERTTQITRVFLNSTLPTGAVWKNGSSNHFVIGKVAWNIPIKVTKLLNYSVSATTKKTEAVRNAMKTSPITSTLRRQRSATTATRSQHSEPIANETMLIRKTRFGADDHLFLSVNGSCEHLDASAQTTTDFATAFEQKLEGIFQKIVFPGKNNSEPPAIDCRTWEIRCGPNLVLNFTVTNMPFELETLREVLFSRPLFSFTWNGQVYSATGLSDLYVDLVPSSEKDLARLQVGPATGHFYQGFIYIIIGIVVAVVALILATVCLVRMHRRQGRHRTMTATSSGGESTPTSAFHDANDYTLTRIPRTTKLYMDEMERNRIGWGYTNPDYQPDTIVKKREDSGHLQFVNSGVLPEWQEGLDEGRTRTGPIGIRPADSDSPSGSQQTNLTSNLTSNLTPLGRIRGGSFGPAPSNSSSHPSNSSSRPPSRNIGPFSIPGDFSLTESVTHPNGTLSRVATETSTHI